MQGDSENIIETTEPTVLALRDGEGHRELMPVYTLQLAKQRREQLVKFTREMMVEGVDFGAIGGTDRKKNTLLKPGAEKLSSFFGLTPRFDPMPGCVEDWKGGFFHYRYRCVLSRNGIIVGDGIGSCNSREKKYRYRYADRLCPACGKPTIRNAGADWDCKYYCHKKSGGCGERFGADPRIESQKAGLVENPEPFDAVNTLDKMAQKRSLVAAVLIAVNASEFFTQDLEDFDFEPLATPDGAGTGGAATPRRTNGDAQGEPPDDTDQRPPSERRRGGKPKPDGQTPASSTGAAGPAKPAAAKTPPAKVHNPEIDGLMPGDATKTERDYSSNKVFMADFAFVCKQRLGFDERAALGLLGQTARGHQKPSLDACDNDWRNSIMASVEGGLFDYLKGKVMKASDLPGAQQANGSGHVEGGAASGTAPAKPAAADGTSDRPAASVPMPDEVKDYEKFRELWDDAAVGIGWTSEQAARALKMRLQRVARADKPETTTITWRQESILALRENRLDVTTGALIEPNPAQQPAGSSTPRNRRRK